MPNHHVIVGDGLSAAEFATTRQYRANDKLTIIGPDVSHLGRGAAYAKAPPDAPWRFAYLLNSPARSVDPDFAHWVTTHWEQIVLAMSGRSPDWINSAQPYSSVGELTSLNVPREFFGDFLHAATNKKLDKLSDEGVRIERLQACVDRIEQSDSGLTVITSDAKRIDADSVDVATGGPSNQRFPGDDSDCTYPALFGNEERIAKKLSIGKDVICIGASAAMLDCLRFCQSIQRETDIQFTALSPSGTILEALRPSLNFRPTQFELDGTFNSATEFLAAITKLQQGAIASGDSLYATRVGMRELFKNKSLNEFVPNVTEARKVTRPLFNHFQGGTRDSIDDFNRLMGTGNTRIVAGRVKNISNHNTIATVKYTDCTGKEKKLSASVVVNCAGPGREHRYDKLTTDMLRQNWISICLQSGGILVGNDGQTTVKGLRYLGPSVTSIGDKTEPVPLYDASRLRHAVQRFNHYDEG